MGWFFLGKPKSQTSSGRRKAGRRDAAKPAEPVPWDPHRTVARLKLLGAIGLVVAVVVGWHFGYDALHGYMKRTAGRPITVKSVHLADPPAWMSQTVRWQLRRTVAVHATSDPMDGRSLRVAVMALGQVPWVRQVVQIRRTRGGQLTVQARYRRPMAVVQCRDGYRLVGADGTELLAQPYYKKQLAELGLPVILGVRSAPPVKPGSRWADADLLAGLKLVALLADQPFFGQVRAVDVSQHDIHGRLRLAIGTHDGGWVYWGFAPGHSGAIEPSAAVKIARLRELARLYHGSIDAGGQRVEIYGSAIETARPMAEARSAKFE